MDDTEYKDAIDGDIYFNPVFGDLWIVDKGRFIVKDCTTKIRISEAIIKTLNEITSLNECGVISDEEFIRLGRELWM